MVIERFKNDDSAAVYRRFQVAGRMLPEGLVYTASWVTAELNQCFQLMETSDVALLELWMSHWRDLVDFEVHEVVSSTEAVQRSGRP